MDEPLTGVDETTEHIIMEKFLDFQRQGKTVVAVHHDLSTLENYFDYLIVLNRTLKAIGPMAQTLTEANLASAYRG